MKKPNTYTSCYWNEYNFKWLKSIDTEKKYGKKQSKTLNSCFLMLDTETSKSEKSNDNYVIYFTISMNYHSKDVFTLHGYNPSDAVKVVKKVHDSMPGDTTYIYVQNLSYDWTFLRKFFFREIGHPVKQLNTKSHYPIYIEFANGITLRDSLILSQRKLEKWGKDLNVEHKKAVGYWDYEKKRNQNDSYTEKEKQYAEFDTLCGVECLEKTRQMLGKRIGSMPWTATGIARDAIRKEGKKNHAKDWFLKIAPDFLLQKQLEMTYHGGFTHANRHLIGEVVKGTTKCYDFSSSYPYCLIAFKYPSERFFRCPNCKIQKVLDDSEEYAFTFKLIALDVDLKQYDIPMPALQYSKCVKVINPVIDNGRLLSAKYIEIYLTEMDLLVINEQYNFSKNILTDVYASKKDYLPRWFTDLVYQFFKEKTVYKDGDKVIYAIKKALLNSLYGCCVQKPVKDDIEEVYEYEQMVDKKAVYLKEKLTIEQEQKKYQKFLENRNNILPYQIGVWCTAYAFYNLFQLGKCAGTWIYSDTDSCYGQNWDIRKINKYNDACIQRLKERGYEGVEHNGKVYNLGVATSEDSEDLYTEFVTLGAKRYAGRCMEDNLIHITVAGVPKKGAACFKNDINNFKKGFVFHGTKTGKLTHEYIYKEGITIDEDGNEIGDSINLTPCDYILDEAGITTWEDIITEEIEINLPGL